jgi:DNA helicase IV
MQLRMIARRAPSGSMTVLGDVAQATGEWPHRTWDEVLEHLPVRRAGSRVAVLRIGYRVPAQILEMANRLLPSISPDLEPAEPVRAHEPPSFERVPAGALVRSTVRAMEGAMAQRGTVGVIVPESVLDQVEDLARVQHVEADAADHGRGRKVTLLTARQSKGLEFDHVLLAEPAAFLDERGDGIRHLYVALTRATQTLHVLHERDVPGVLA